MISRHWKGFAKVEAAENYIHHLRIWPVQRGETANIFVNLIVAVLAGLVA